MSTTAITKLNTLASSLLGLLLDIHQTRNLHLQHLKQIHSLLVTCGLSQHTFLLTKLLSKATNYLPYASLLFAHIQVPNTHQWNIVIGGFSTSSHPHMSLAFYVSMLRNGASPDKHTFPLLLKAFSKLKSENPFQFYAHIVKFGFNYDQFVRNSLISAFANSGYMEHARQLFGESSQKDVVSWTAMIDGCVKNGCAIDALRCFMEMRSMGVKVDEVTVVSVLSAVGMVGDVWFGRWLHGFYIEAGRVKWDVYLGSALVDVYSKCGHCGDAHRAFNEMPYRNVVSWSALIAGYVQCNKFKDALLVFQDLLIDGVKPNESTLTSVITACAHLGALDQGKWIHGYIDKSKLEMNSTLGTALIDMYSKCGCINEALLVFETLLVKDVYPWTAMICGLAMHGDALGSLNFFSQMLSSGVQPNEVTFIGVLSACSHGGLVDEGRRLFGMMKDIYNIEPTVDHYGCMVDLLGRAGQLLEASKLIEEMPMEPTAGVWGALFGACMIQKDFELGEYVGNKLIKLQSGGSGRFMLLANLYSSCRRWDEAANVRKLMKGKRVVKLRGCSWIQVNGIIHEFIAFDRSHSQSDALYKMLNHVVLQLKNACCVPNSLSFDSLNN